MTGDTPSRAGAAEPRHIPCVDCREYNARHGTSLSCRNCRWEAAGASREERAEAQDNAIWRQWDEIRAAWGQGRHAHAYQLFYASVRNTSASANCGQAPKTVVAPPAPEPPCQHCSHASVRCCLCLATVPAPETPPRPETHMHGGQPSVCAGKVDDTPFGPRCRGYVPIEAAPPNAESAELSPAEESLADYEAFTAEPERMSVGRLNHVVRALREAVYQERLKAQALRERCEGLEKALGHLDDCDTCTDLPGHCVTFQELRRAALSGGGGPKVALEALSEALDEAQDNPAFKAQVDADFKRWGRSGGGGGK